RRRGGAPGFASLADPLCWCQRGLSTGTNARLWRQACVIATWAAWSRRWDSNPRPATYEAAALPAELRRRFSDGIANFHDEIWRCRESLGEHRAGMRTLHVES